VLPRFASAHPPSQIRTASLHSSVGGGYMDLINLVKARTTSASGGLSLGDRPLSTYSLFRPLCVGSLMPPSPAYATILAVAELPLSGYLSPFVVHCFLGVLAESAGRITTCLVERHAASASADGRQPCVNIRCPVRIDHGCLDGATGGL